MRSILTQNKQDHKGALRWLRRETLGNLFLVAMLFGTAGTWHWLMGWALCGIYLLWSLGTGLLILPINPAMLAERARPHPDMRGWDKLLLGLMSFGMLAEYITASLDLRFGWTQPFSPPIQVAGLLAAFLGYDVLLLWSMRVNAYFVAMIRIQSERGQSVITHGPYRFVRHPGYLGTILLHLGVPFMLNSSWALLPGLLAALALVVRTGKEDAVLQSELPGYAEYTESVRWRLVPGVF